MTFPIPNISNDLTGNVAMVTGASSGLGWRFAQVIARCGARVVVTARRVDRQENLANEIRAEGGEVLALALDVTGAAQITEVVDKAASQWGPITMLVNNAGIPDAQYATRMSIDLIDRVLDTNIRAPFILSTEIARRLIASGKPGRIVNIASMAAFSYGGGGAALYSTSKAAVIRMTESLAVEWARFNINVNAIAPGAFSSEMMDGMLARLGDITQHFPRKRLGQPEQMDSTLLYFLAPASECVTGTFIKIDDGQHER